MKTPITIWVSLLLLTQLGGCATHQSIHPSIRNSSIRNYVEQDLISYERVSGDPFEHLIIYPKSTGDHPTAPPPQNKPIYIYLDGDGSLLKGQKISRDPTPLRPLALELMLEGPKPALYLGRPCQFIQNSHCTLEFWTVSRYSESVVHSLVVAINKLNQENHPITLVGYSGGGSLAVLVASRLPAVSQVITLAANLDTQAWAVQHHSVNALSNSLNPADLMAKQGPPLAFKGWHFLGLQDEIVPPRSLKHLQAEAQPSQTWCYLEGAHTETWPTVWPQIWQTLAKLDLRHDLDPIKQNGLFHCE